MQQRNRVLVFAVLISLASSALFGQSLTLDAGFGDGGTLLDADAGFAIRSVLVQPDGRILFLGVGAAGDVLGRYLANGAPDPSFAVPPIPSMTLWGMALQTDGKIVVVGYSGSDFGIVRLLPGGSPDPAFDGDGHDSVDFSGGFDHATAVAIQSDGKIVVA
ncbi:MAG TPA: hypothetical protein VIB08_09740, partial [Thermoanaerobaculia bacterium]